MKQEPDPNNPLALFLIGWQYFTKGASIGIKAWGLFIMFVFIHVILALPCSGIRYVLNDSHAKNPNPSGLIKFCRPFSIFGPQI